MERVVANRVPRALLFTKSKRCVCSERPDQLVLSVVQRHVLSASDVVATDGASVSVGSVLRTSVGVPVQAIIHTDLVGDAFVVPVHDMLAGPLVGLDIFLALGPISSGGTSPNASSAIDVSLSLTFLGEDGESGTFSLVVPVVGDTSLRVEVSNSQRRGLNGESYWASPLTYRPVQLLVCRMNNNTASGAIVPLAVFHVIVNVWALG